MNNKKINREVRNPGKFISVLSLIFFLMFFPLKAQIKNVDSLIEVINHSRSYEAIEKAKDKIPSYLHKVDYKLLDVVRQVKLAGITHLNAENNNVHNRFSNQLVEVNDQANFHVKIYLKQLDENNINKLKAMGIIVQSAVNKYNQVFCWVPFDAIDALSKDNNILRISNVGKTHHNTDPYKTVGDQILNAVTARTSFGINGSGIKIGVISDGVYNYQDVINAGYLDASKFHRIFDPLLHRNEGTAMSEIVHVLAPQADIYFESDGGDELTFWQSQQDLTSPGYNCKIIVDDVGITDEPMFEDGYIAQWFDENSAQGVIHVSSSGNQAKSTWNGMSADANHNTWMEFYNSEEIDGITVQPYSTITATLQWANDWLWSNDDFDLWLYETPDLSSPLKWGIQHQEGIGSNPIETFYWTNATSSPKTVYFRVKLNNISTPREVMLVVWGTYNEPLFHYQGRSIFGHAAANSCISVGAINSSDGQSIEDFSCKGPSRIYDYAYGNPTTYTDRLTPTICGIDNVQTYISNGTSFWLDPPGNFRGTSAAAPHIAAIAALILQQHGNNLNWEKVKSILTLSADKVSGMGGQNYTNAYGFGRSNAYTSCRNLYVPQVYTTIQSALSAVKNGQTIVVNSGTYNENLTVGDKNNLTITGQGAANTIINGSLSAFYCNNLNINSLRLNSLTAIYCNLGDFHNNIYGGGMGLYSCTGFDQFGYITNCSIGLNASSSTGHIYPTSNYSSNGTSISCGAGNILVDCTPLCTSVNYDFAVSGNGYISSYLCYFRNGQPRINNSGGTVSINYPMSCGMAKESNTANIQDDVLIAPIQSEDPVEIEFSKINTSYFSLLKQFKEAKAKGTMDIGELKNQFINNTKDFKNFIKKNPQTSLSLIALITAANSFSFFEDNNSMKNFLDEIINDKELTSLKGTAENLMIDYYINIKDFEGAVSMADAFINNYTNDEDLVCEGLLKKGIILAHKMNQPERGAECFTAVVNDYPDNPITEFAKNELKVLGEEGGYFVKENLTAENFEFTTSSYPNPFNPTTMIKYSLPTDEKVVIKVYDILGREIAVLVNELKTEGTYSVQFDGSNLSSGIYFYRIEAGKFSQTKKLVLTK